MPQPISTGKFKDGNLSSKADSGPRICILHGTHEILQVAQNVITMSLRPLPDLRAPVHLLPEARCHKLLSWPINVFHYDCGLIHPSLEPLKQVPYT